MWKENAAISNSQTALPSAAPGRASLSRVSEPAGIAFLGETHSEERRN